MTRSSSRFAKALAGSVCVLMLFGAYLPRASAGAPPTDAVVTVPSPIPLSDSAATMGDFNNDGFQDLVFTAPGVVGVFAGSAAGLSSTYVELDVGGGESIAAGDFNGDGFDDVVVGDYFDIAVIILSGSAAGLDPESALMITQNTPGVPGRTELGDEFGEAVATGDFDNDGFDDLAVGVPEEDVGSLESAGMIIVFRGAATGLSATGSLMLHQGSPGVPFRLEASDQFGKSLTSGDFNGDGFADLAVGSPGEDINSSLSAGAVHVFSGSLAGLSGDLSVGFTQSGPIPGTPERYDQFGSTLASGDFDNDGYDDLVIGIAGEGVAFKYDAGMVTIVSGSPAGVDVNDAYRIDQSSPDVPGTPQNSDNFGSVLAVGDFDGDSFDDLAVGTPREFVPSVQRRGIVTVLFGSSTGANGNADAVLLRSGRNLPDLPEDQSFLGLKLVAVDGNNSGRPELVTTTRTSMITITWD